MTKIDKSTVSQYVRHPFERVRTPTVIVGESMTHQSHAESCDINTIIRQFDRTGILPPVDREAQYADVTALQEGDLTERINFSRETLDEAGRLLEENQAAAREADKNKQIDLEDQIKRLEAEIIKQKESQAPKAE